MKHVSTLVIWAVIAIHANTTNAETVTTLWDSNTDTHAFGSLDGIGISATSKTSASFDGFTNRRFDTEAGGGWDADFPLSPATRALVALQVNAGDFQEFRFDEALDEGQFYIENFDSNSVARVSAKGATTLELLSASPSISFSNLSNNVGTLRTSNPTFNGEGDAILGFTGDVEAIRIDYFNGDGDNGVFYSFTKENTAAVPEPTAGRLAIILALLPLKLRKRRLDT